MRFLSWSIPLGLAGLSAVFISCATTTPTQQGPIHYPPNHPLNPNNRGVVATPEAQPVNLPPLKSPSQLYREANVNRILIPYGKHARKYRRYMKPRYITIHSTQNYSPAADALQHSRALNNGKLRAYKRRGGNRIGYLVWHYTIDQGRVVQHLPDNEQGEHADFNGPGNNYSLGLEMCENRGNSRAHTIDRTARLTAYLMHKHKIPLRNVVPHYHWPRKGLRTQHKNCPHYLLDNGRPGAKWRWFQSRVNFYYKQITEPAPQFPIAMNAQ